MKEITLQVKANIGEPVYMVSWYDASNYPEEENPEIKFGLYEDGYTICSIELDADGINYYYFSYEKYLVRSDVGMFVSREEFDNFIETVCKDFNDAHLRKNTVIYVGENYEPEYIDSAYIDDGRILIKTNNKNFIYWDELGTEFYLSKPE